MKSVCIVGAGPAGLVGVKALLQTSQFKVTVFEKGSRIGGIWAVDESTKSGLLSPYTPTNISRFTVGFSDLDWNAVHLQKDRETGATNGDATTHPPVPMFPFAWQVNRYLEEFRERYIPRDVIHLEHEVVAATRVVTDSSSHWKVTVRGKQSGEQSQEFDYLIIASGFFSSPRPLDYNLALKCKADPATAIRILHTSEVRTLRDLYPNPQRAQGRKILVFGGGNSSGETAAALAMQLSDVQHSPAKDTDRTLADTSIVHVTPRPLYAIPPFNPVDEDCRTFLPLDLKFYDLSKRPEGPIESNAGVVTRGVKDMMHTALKSMVGGNQSDLGSDALTVPFGEPRSPVYVTLSETYPEYVRSGSIQTMPGRVTAIQDTADGTASVIVDSRGARSTISDVAAIVYATGYAGWPAVSFLDDDVKDKLQYDPGSMRLPLILSGYQTYSPAVPDLAFLGFYESPYWTMVEMQAEMTATRWLTNEPIPSRPFEDADTMLALRKAMRAGSLDVPQYWFGDHLGYLEEAATHLKRTRNNGAFDAREGPVSSARYRSSYTNTEQADAIMADLHNVWQACTKEGRYVARAAFRALQGNWTIRRTIDSALPSFPSGTLEGTASFHPRRPTADKSGKQFDFEYLYIESGTLVLSGGASFPATRRYVYRYSEARDELSVWFVKPDHELEVDYLFHNLDFIPPDEARKAGACVAKADHLCSEDMYWTEYRLPIMGIALQGFEARHTVKGPSKDYVATTLYRRPELSRGVVS